MTHTVTNLQEDFEKGLRQYIHTLPADTLHAPMKYILGIGGKRVRPVLVMLAGEAFGAPLDKLLSAALAVELFHNFSLIHDDIMDAAPLRRGEKTVHAKWNTNAAILSGDAMLIEAYKQLAKAAPEHLAALLHLFNSTSLEVCRGQQLDMDFERIDDVTIDQYVEMIGLKTAVLLGCSLKMGAILAQASETDCNSMYAFGKMAGVGFQIQDDYLDAFGDPMKFGKQTGGDIRSNKKTFLIIRALEKADPETRIELESIYFRNALRDEEEKVERVLSIFDQLEIGPETLRESKKFFKEAAAELDKVSLRPDQKAGLQNFLDELQQRSY